MARPHHLGIHLSTPHSSLQSLGKRCLSLALLWTVATCTEDRTPTSPVLLAALMQTVTQTLLTSGTNATNQAVYTTASIAPTTNALITVAVLGRRSTGAQTPTITGGGMTSWTLVASVDYDVISTPLSRVSVFRALSSAPGSGPLTITFSNSQSNATWIVSQWDGVDVSGVNGAGAIAQSGSARGDAVSSLSKTLAAFGDPNDVAYGVVGVGLNGPAVTPGSGFTEIAEPTSGESNLLEAEWGVNLTNVAAGWTSAKNAGLLGIEIKAGGGGGGVSASQSTVSASPTSILAGSGSSTITVTAKDASGNPVSGATVVLAATGSGNTLTQPSSPTNASGVATGTLSSTVAEAKTTSATANGIAITQTASVTVTSAGGGGTITQTLLTSGTNTTNQAVYTTASIAPTANALITVAVLGRRSTGAQTPTLAGGGMTSWTLVASVDYDVISTPLSRVAVFRAMSSSPGSGPLTITYPNSQSNATWIVSQWSGVDVSGSNGAGAIVQSGSARGDAVSNLSKILAAFASPADVGFGVAGAGLNGPAVTPGNGFTEIAEPTSGENNLLEAEWGVNLTNVSASWTAAKNAGLLGIEIKAGAAQTDTTRPPVPTELGGPAEILTLGIKGETIFRNVAEVRFDDTTSGVTVQSFLQRYSARITGGTPISRAYILEIPDPGTTWEEYYAVIQAMRSEPGVTGVPIVSIKEMRVTSRFPRDSAAFGADRQAWLGAPNDYTRSRMAVRAPLAWGCENGLYGAGRVRIGLLDFLFANHDLDSSVVTPWQPPGNVLKHDTINNIKPWTYNHGTGIESILAATGDNGRGIAGMVWGADLWVFQTSVDSSGALFSTNPEWVFAKAMLDAAANDVHVFVSADLLYRAHDSAGNLRTSDISGIEQDLRWYLNKDPDNLYIQALNNRTKTWTLADLQSGLTPQDSLTVMEVALARVRAVFPNQIITVVGTDAQGTLANFSDQWTGATDIAAPGVQILMLSYAGGDTTGSGDSFAAPFVGGVAAQLRAMDPTLTAAQVKDYILRGARQPRWNTQAGQLATPQPVPGAPTNVYQLDAYGSLTLLAQEHSTTPICGFPVQAADSGILIERPSGQPQLIPAPAGWFIDQVSVAQGGRLISADVEDGSLNFELRLWTFANGTWSGPTSTTAYANRQYLEKDTVYIKWRDYTPAPPNPAVYPLPLITIKRADGSSRTDLDLYTPQFPPDAVIVKPAVFLVNPMGVSPTGEWAIVTMFYQRLGDGGCQDARQRLVNIQTGVATQVADRLVVDCAQHLQSGSLVRGVAWSQGGDAAVLARDTTTVPLGAQTATRLVRIQVISTPSGTDSLDIAYRYIDYLRYLPGDALLLSQEWVEPSNSPCTTEVRNSQTFAHLATNATTCPFAEYYTDHPNVIAAEGGVTTHVRGLSQRRQGPVQVN
jgi:hypothetical protein